MSLRNILPVGLLASAALAVPTSIPKRSATCPDTLGDEKFAAEVAWYTDEYCSQPLRAQEHSCYYGGFDGSGTPGCAPGTLPPQSNLPFYGMMVDAASGAVELQYTRDQVCAVPSQGVFVTMVNNAECIEFNLGGDAPGVQIFGKGGAPILRTGNPPAKRDSHLTKRRDAKCDSFRVDSQTATYSQSVQLSPAVSCLNGNSAGCSISISKQHTESITTSYNLMAGGVIAEVFMFGASFGMSYTESTTTELQESVTVPEGQTGYLTAYSAATLFEGTFVGCDQGDDEQPGSALVLRENGLTYNVVLTGAA